MIEFKSAVKIQICVHNISQKVNGLYLLNRSVSIANTDAKYLEFGKYSDKLYYLRLQVILLF